MDYEKTFTDNLFQKLRDKLYGKVTVYVNNDILVVKIENFDFKFEKTYFNFAEKVYHGFNSEFVTYEFCEQYKRFILNRFFR